MAGWRLAHAHVAAMLWTGYVGSLGEINRRGGWLLAAAWGGREGGKEGEGEIVIFVINRCRQ